MEKKLKLKISFLKNTQIVKHIYINKIYIKIDISSIWNE